MGWDDPGDPAADRLSAVGAGRMSQESVWIGRWGDLGLDHRFEELWQPRVPGGASLAAVAPLAVIALLMVATPAAVAASPAEEGVSPQSEQAAPASETSPKVSPSAKPAPKPVEIVEYRIDGADLLSQEEVERAVYPYLGPDKTADDVEAARAALEKAYAAKGYQTVAVSIPGQQVKDGVVTLKVIEGKVGRLRVKGARYYDIDEIKEAAPSLKEGTVPDFNAVSGDIVALNQLPDRKVTPSLRAGKTPGTVDVDLSVEDTFPLHGSMELNNRYSADPSKLRLNGSLRYDNLWQLGHSISLGYQVAPQNTMDSKVYSASYLARFSSVPWLSVLGYWVKQNSDVNTLGSMNVAGKGDIVGGRAIITLPGEEGFFHTLSVGVDRKKFQERVNLEGEEAYSTPITYYPMTAAYAATWMGDDRSTQLNASVTANFRPTSSDWEEFDTKRYKATGGFAYFRGDLAHTEGLPYGAQGWAKIQGQLSNDPLVSSEEFSAGGLDTVRGYLESEVLGDNAALGSVELRSPSLTTLLGDDVINEWRIHAFVDGGRLSIKEALSEQDSRFSLWSYGVGTRFRLVDYLNGSFDVGIPMVTQGNTRRGSARATFRVWGEF